MNEFQIDGSMVCEMHRDTFNDSDKVSIKAAMVGLILVIIFAFAVAVYENGVIASKKVIMSEDISSEKLYFGDEVSEDTKITEEIVADNFFTNVDVSSKAAELRANSEYSFDESDFEARGIEKLADKTKLLSVDRVTSIEDEYRVYVTLAVVDADDLMTKNQAYSSQYFMSSYNHKTEDGLNRLYIELLDNNNDLTGTVQTYITVNADGSVDSNMLVSAYLNILAQMQN